MSLGFLESSGGKGEFHGHRIKDATLEGTYLGGRKQLSAMGDGVCFLSQKLVVAGFLYLCPLASLVSLGR